MNLATFAGILASGKVPPTSTTVRMEDSEREELMESISAPCIIELGLMLSMYSARKPGDEDSA